MISRRRAFQAMNISIQYVTRVLSRSIGFEKDIGLTAVILMPPSRPTFSFAFTSTSSDDSEGGVGLGSGSFVGAFFRRLVADTPGTFPELPAVAVVSAIAASENSRLSDDR